MSQARERKTTVVYEGILILVVVKGPILAPMRALEHYPTSSSRESWLRRSSRQSGSPVRGWSGAFPLFNSRFLLLYNRDPFHLGHAVEGTPICLQVS